MTGTGPAASSHCSSGFEGEFRRSLANLVEVLAAAGSDLANVIQTHEDRILREIARPPELRSPDAGRPRTEDDRAGIRDHDEPFSPGVVAPLFGIHREGDDPRSGYRRSPGARR